MEAIKPAARLSPWKRVKQTPAFQRGKLLVKRLTGRELWLRPEVQYPQRRYGEWTICPELLEQRVVVYSMGIGDNIDFELAVMDEWGAEVHAFDPTPPAAWVKNLGLPDRFHFHAWAAAAEDGELMLYPRIKRDGSTSDDMYTLVAGESGRHDGIKVPAKSISSIMATLGHDSVDIIKLDIEGAEYEVLEDLLSEKIRPRHLLVEFHHRFPGIGKSMTTAIVRQLRLNGYRILFVSATGREVSFIRT
ncbi:MAG: FkbM family methyltransferase [Gammaproteobacteria bacterium]|nr:FkbM family methyltransferase [Gammaproteobacteria bacterium]